MWGNPARLAEHLVSVSPPGSPPTRLTVDELLFADPSVEGAWWRRRVAPGRPLPIDGAIALAGPAETGSVAPVPAARDEPVASCRLPSTQAQPVALAEPAVLAQAAPRGGICRPPSVLEAGPPVAAARPRPHGPLPD
eukprot:3466364-Pyramimonas_sp.AAC.1